MICVATALSTPVYQTWDVPVVLNSFTNLLGDNLLKFVKLSPVLLGALGGDLGLRNYLLKGLNHLFLTQLSPL